LNSFGFYEHYGVLARMLSVYRTLGQYSIYPEQKGSGPFASATHPYAANLGAR
jgi:hypothetical protein